VPNPPSEELVSAILAHYEAEKPRYINEKAVSIYFGGGTPSLMQARQIGRILERISRDFSLNGMEISLEVNPGTVKAADLLNIKAAGINRLSIGVQSFSDEVLEFLGRPHTSKEALEIFEAARKAGFENLGIDIILGPLPQTVERLRHDLVNVGELAPEFVSAYMLSIEDGTPFARMQSEGMQLSRSEDEICQQYEMTCEHLERIGIQQYEISNFAREGYKAVHNSLYWTGDEYMGLGPGAHGFYYDKRYYSAIRYANLSDPDAYILAAANAAVFSSSQEALDSDTLAREALFCRLRTSAGLELELLKERFGLDLLRDRTEIVNHYRESGMIELLNEPGGMVMRLTSKGRLFADEVSLDFF